MAWARHLDQDEHGEQQRDRSAAGQPVRCQSEPSGLWQWRVVSFEEACIEPGSSVVPVCARYVDEQVCYRVGGSPCNGTAGIGTVSPMWRFLVRSMIERPAVIVGV
ncbi:MAG: hypothetical protein VX589_06615 [Myxococcota bacterium]|nr:hypothetical protein [Myxococcota bacterium]